jgi:hypothetical protein
MWFPGIRCTRPQSVTAYSAWPPGRRSHDAVARLDARDLAADRRDLAGTFQAQPRPHAADPAVLMTGGNQQIGAIEARCAHPDQDFVGRGHGLGKIAKLDPRLPQNGSFHGRFLLLSNDLYIAMGEPAPHSRTRRVLFRPDQAILRRVTVRS